MMKRTFILASLLASLSLSKVSAMLSDEAPFDAYSHMCKHLKGSDLINLREVSRKNKQRIDVVFTNDAKALAAQLNVFEPNLESKAYLLERLVGKRALNPALIAVLAEKANKEGFLFARKGSQVEIVLDLLGKDYKRIGFRDALGEVDQAGEWFHALFGCSLPQVQPEMKIDEDMTFKMLGLLFLNSFVESSDDEENTDEKNNNPPPGRDILNLLGDVASQMPELVQASQKNLVSLQSNRARCDYLGQLTASMPVEIYSTTDGEEKATLAKFSQVHGAGMVACLTQMRAQKPYFSFLHPESDVAFLAQQPHHIVLSMKQLSFPDDRNALAHFLSSIHHHTVSLAIDTGRDGVLLTPDIYFSMDNLRIVDVTGTCHTLQNSFYTFKPRVGILDLSGLKNLKRIGERFFMYTDITTVTGLRELEYVGPEFLKNCRNISEADKQALLDKIQPKEK